MKPDSLDARKDTIVAISFVVGLTPVATILACCSETPVRHSRRDRREYHRKEVLRGHVCQGSKLLS